MEYLSDKALNEMSEEQLRNYIHLLYDVIRKQSDLNVARKDITNKNYEMNCNTGLLRMEDIVEKFKNNNCSGLGYEECNTCEMQCPYR